MAQALFPGLKAGAIRPPQANELKLRFQVLKQLHQNRLRLRAAMQACSILKEWAHAFLKRSIPTARRYRTGPCTTSLNEVHAPLTIHEKSPA